MFPLPIFQFCHHHGKGDSANLPELHPESESHVGMLPVAAVPPDLPAAPASQQDPVRTLTLIRPTMKAGYFRPCSWEAAEIRLIQSCDKKTQENRC